MEVISLPVELETYDESLNSILLEAIEKRSEVIELVAECLWVYASADPKRKRHQTAHRFQELLATRVTREPSTAASRNARWDQDRIVCLNTTFALPMSKPLFIRQLDSRVIASATYGDLMFKTCIYLDLKRFAAVIEDNGARFTWASEKDTRRARAM
jgi:hypothetical protein